MTRRLLAVQLAVLLAGTWSCGNGDNSGADADTGGDTDTDIDTDTDTDTDSDSDTDTDTDSDTDADTDSDTDTDTDSDSDADTDSDSDADTGPGNDTETESETETCTAVHPEPVTVVIEGEWTVIPDGGFWMGSPAGWCPSDYPGCHACLPELGRDSDESLHWVLLTRTFAIQQTEVTQGGFAAVMGWNPSHFGPEGPGEDCGDACPVENVGWYDTLAFANELSLAADLAPCYSLTDVMCRSGASVAVGANYMECFDDDAESSAGIHSATVSLDGVATIYDCEGYRLPTEAEWERAARAGSLTAFHPSDGNDGSITYDGVFPLDPNLAQIGWYAGNSSSGPRAVAGKEPNDWGLFDMAGNVWEWTWDGYFPSFPAGSTEEPVVDPEVLPTGANRSIRGGSWNFQARQCRSAARMPDTATNRGGHLGFRLARTI